MFKIKKQLRSIYIVSALSSFQLAGASWVALLAARGFSLVQIGIAESVFHLASLLFEIPSGVISDVFGRKWSMVLSQLLFLLSALCMACSATFGGICAALVLDALGYNFASGAREALLYDSLRSVGQEDHYLDAIGREYAIYRIGNALAILCAGLALWLGHRLAYLLDAAMALLGILSAVQLTEITLDQHPSETPILHQIRTCFADSFRFLLHNRSSLGLMLWNALVGAMATLTLFFLQARLPQAGLPQPILGPALFLISLGGALGAKLAVRFAAWSYQRLSILCCTATAFGILCGISPWPLLMIVGGFSSGLCDDLLQVRSDALLNDRFPSSQRATLLSVSSLSLSLVMILLSPLAGILFSG